MIYPEIQCFPNRILVSLFLSSFWVCQQDYLKAKTKKSFPSWKKTISKLFNVPKFLLNTVRYATAISTLRRRDCVVCTWLCIAQVNGV